MRKFSAQEQVAICRATGLILAISSTVPTILGMVYHIVLISGTAMVMAVVSLVLTCISYLIKF
jgi:hypothetical protein